MFGCAIHRVTIVRIFRLHRYINWIDEVQTMEKSGKHGASSVQEVTIGKEFCCAFY
jgi:hypothetical protein